MKYTDPLGLDNLKDGNVAWHPLVTHSTLANSVEDISANIESALQRDYIPFNRLVGKKSGAVAIVGSGPSLKGNWHELKALQAKGVDIVACNASCQFLLEKGLVPDYMMCFDADPLMLEFITPHPEITYLLASRCPPKAFDMLKDCKVVCWHAGADEKIEELLEKYQRLEPMVIGGTAAVTRAMILVLPIGYRTVHIFGGDSSFSKDGDTHIRKSTTDERRMAVMCNGRVFETAPWMTQQIEDFKTLGPKFRDLLGIEYIVHGDSLFAHVAKLKGFETDFESRRRASFMAGVRKWKRNATILWQNI
jgi:hypothetical protein